MIKNIYLHIGLHKTASSSIQQVLFNNRHLLTKEGYLYPEFIIGDRKITNHSEVFYSMFYPRPDKYHINMLKACNTIEKTNSLHESYRQQFKKQVTSFEGHSLVISGEDISHLSEHSLWALKQYFIENTHPDVSFKIIAFVRHPVDWTVSKIQEVIKSGNSMHDAVDRILKNPLCMLQTEKFKKVFTNHVYDLYRFEDAVQHPGGITGKFLSIIGVDDITASKIKSEFVNASLSYEATVLLGTIYSQMPLFKEGSLNPDLKDFGRHVFNQMPGQKFSIDPRLISEIWEKAMPDVTWLHEEMNFPLYRFENRKEDDSQKWSEETIRFINTGFLMRFTPKIRCIVLDEILKALKKYGKSFDFNKRTMLYDYWLNNSAFYNFKSKRQKLLYTSKYIGFVNSIILSISVLSHRKFNWIFDRNTML